MVSETPVTQVRQRGCQVFAARFCLLAVALLYAPLAGAAWANHAVACCSGDHCAIPQHHHSKAPPQPAAHEDCDHDASGLVACSMSCCENADQPVLTAMIFLLPQWTLDAMPNPGTR